MKVLIVTSLFPEHPNDKNGKFIYDSIHALRELGHEIKVLVPRSWKPKWLTMRGESSLKANVFPSWLDIKICYFFSLPRYRFFSFSIYSYAWFVSSKNKKKATTWKCDIIHGHSEVHALTIAKVGEKLNIPTITTIHGAETNKRYWRAKKLIAKGLEKTTRIILVGKAIKPIFDKLVRCSENFRIVTNGFTAPMDIYQKKIAYWSYPIKLISVSTLADEGKAIDINLYALAKLNQQGITAWEYTIVGEGCFRASLEELTKKLQLTSQVRFVGACDHQEIYHYLLQSHVFCLPSYREAFGIAHLEAMACGLLVIAALGQGPETFVKHGETGMLVAPKDATALADCLQYVFTHQEHMQAIRARGKELAWQEYTWQHHAKQLAAVYEDVMFQEIILVQR